MEQPNSNYIKELSGGDLTFEDKLIHVIKTEWPVEVEEYENNMGEFAFAKAALNVHKIKHKLGIVGLVDGYELAVRFEEELKVSQLDSKLEFESILKAVTNFINGL